MRLRILFILLALIITQFSYAQQKTITGLVSDQLSGEPLPGVTVVVDGTTIGTITDLDGKYAIVVNNSQVLVFSYIGYTKQTIMVSGQTEINIKMGANIEDLGEVVVIGYGTVKKSDATGSVTSVTSDDFNKGAITSPQELIMGKSAGVVITSQGGQAGAGATIRIRGGSSLEASNDPLIVVDGFPLSNSGISGLSNTLSTINPNDIESMTILKDASATAIFGSRASNGVVIITTKKGKAGNPFKIAYNGNTSMSQQVKFPEVFNGDEFRALIQQRVDEKIITNAALNRIGTENTDWQKEIYRNAISMDHNLSLTGSLKNMPYRASLGYTDQNGTLKKNNMKRTTIDLSAAPSFFDNHMKVNLNVKGIDIRQDFSDQGAIGAAVVFDPTQPIMNGNTRYGGYTTWTASPDSIDGTPNTIATSNPAALLAFSDNKSHVNRLIGNAQVDYQFHAIQGLRANLNMGYDVSSSAGHNYVDPRAPWGLRSLETNINDYEQQLKNQLFDFYLNYNKELPSISSKFDLTAGYSWQHFYNENTTNTRPREMTNGVYINAKTTIDKREYYLASFFGRLNYTLNDRYLLTVTLRNDGSSRFDKDQRWGLFPSAALAWKIKEEPFLKDVKQISELKLRLGWGVTGQQDISENWYPYLPTYVKSSTGAYYQFGDTFYPTLRPDPYDALIKWEETTTKNIGLDFGFFENKLTGSVEVYQRVTDDLLLTNIPIPVGSNFSNALTTNIGSLQNQGIEATLTFRPVSTTDWLVEFGGTFTYNENKITKLSKVNNPNDAFIQVGGISGGVGNTVQVHAIGYPANSFLLKQQVYDQNWDPIEGVYVDLSDQDGSISSGDIAKRYIAGSPAPMYLIGFNTKIAYKDFDFALNARVNIGNYVYNNNASSNAIYDNLYSQSGFASNLLKAVEKTNFKTAQYWSDIYIEDASFLRIDNVGFGYSFSQLFSTKLSGRIGLTVQNALVYTKYSGLDPEVDGGIDNNMYPRPRTFMLGLNLNF
jgi:iron complex outermembrane receptor protein